MSDNEDDLYADLYGGAEQEGAAEGAPAASGGLDDPPEQPKTNSVPSSSGPGYQPPTRTIATWEDGQIQQPSREDAASIRLPNRTSSAPSDNQREQLSSSAGLPPPGARADIPAAGRIDDGKMFIGGLNWDTTDEGLSNYFSQFGGVLSCTVMRDNNTGRSRGFAFLTFENPSSVNDVMIREHFLDGKAIDPKRAIPRSEERTTDKLFVRNIPPGVTQPIFQDYFSKFGMLADCTLMMDRDTREHRGFGFVTFKDEATVDRVVAGQPYSIFGQQIEVKRSAPRRGEEGGRGGFRGGRGGGGHHGAYAGGGHRDQGSNNMMGGNSNSMGMGMPGMNMMMPGFDPNAMAEYFKNMGWGQWNPAMMMMNPMMMGGGMSGGMMMPGMQAQASNNGGAGAGATSSGGNGRASEGRSLSPPPNAPTGPKAGSSASGPVRHNTGGRGYHPYSR